MLKALRRIRTRLDVARGALGRNASPDELLGELFQDVQLRRVFPDSITFVDLVPDGQMKKVLKLYKEQRHDPHFDLHVFVKRHFKEYLKAPDEYTTNPHHTLEEHINELWDVLLRERYRRQGSLLALPHAYIVPGGRYDSQFYWDSYFICLGLAAAGRWRLLEGITKNAAYMLRRFGMIPTANRTYLISRSQPPTFALTVRLLASKEGRRSTLIRYLPMLLLEHKFWMDGQRKLRPNKIAIKRVVRMPGGEVLNRYYDQKTTPRPESYKEDVDTALRATDRTTSKVYIDLRAGAESGWDYSSRWFKVENDISTIHTTDIIPVDLNCLLYTLESTIAEAYRYLKQTVLAGHFEQKANARAAAIQKYCWDKKRGFYMDYDLVAEKHTQSLTIASVFPLFVGIANDEQAKKVAQRVEKDFLKQGGVVTTLVTSGEQWDAPNGWAPLQWVAIRGLRRYGHDGLADEIKQRWITTNEKLFRQKAKLVEKYNVIDTSMPAGDGEYALQDGFGWTNGVLLALLHEDALHWD